MKTEQVNIRPLYIILIILGLAVFVIGMFTDVFIDASKYAAISRYISQSGNLFHPKIMEEPYLQKPPFMFWLSALSFKIFGISNLTYKLPTFLFFLIGIYGTYRLGKLYYGELIGLIASMVLMFSQGMFLYNSDVHTDMLLTSLVILSIWQMAEFLKTGKWLNYFLGFVFAGLGMITKGPIGLLVPLFAIGGHLFLKRKFATLFHYKWIPGFLIILLILFPVLKGLYDQFGMEGIKFYFWTNNAGRITGSYAGKSKDYFFYFHTLLYLFLPWSFFTYICIYEESKLFVINKFRLSSSKEFICWSGILIFIFILSVARMKGPHYMLPVLPLFSLVTAKFIVLFATNPEYERLFRFSIQFQQVLSMILVVLAILVPSVFFPGQKLIIWLFLMLLVFIYIYILIFFEGNGISRFLVYSIIAITTLNFSMNAVLYPEINHFNAAARASEEFNKLAPENAILYTYKYASHETAFYAKNNSLQITDRNRNEVFSTDGNWIYTSKAGLDTMKQKSVSFIIVDTLPYLKMSNLNIGYLTPVSRNKIALETFLVRINHLRSGK
jgi:4-amino-4-deoxy-L-arabinose transferase-like glycosyltransferase